MLKRVIFVVLIISLLFTTLCYGEPKRIGGTSVGDLYILTETIREDEDKNKGEHLIFVVSEEEYTNPYFLARLRTYPKLKDVTAFWKAYVFNEDSNSYLILSTYFVDETGKPLIEQDGDKISKPIKDNKEATTVHNAVIKEIRNNKRKPMINLKY